MIRELTTTPKKGGLELTQKGFMSLSQSTLSLTEIFHQNPREEDSDEILTLNEFGFKAITHHLYDLWSLK